jgi:hypothetical protein
MGEIDLPNQSKTLGNAMNVTWVTPGDSGFNSFGRKGYEPAEKGLSISSMSWSISVA